MAKTTSDISAQLAPATKSSVNVSQFPLPVAAEGVSRVDAATGLKQPAQRGDQRLPERVRALIVLQDEASERLIGWVQLAIASIFGTLYILAPRPVDAPTTFFGPVFVILLLYIIVTVARLALSYRGRLPRFVVLLSIFMDGLLLLSLIWMFHSEYGQPPAFSLKVPTFLYIFVFIALRALRFDHRYVLTAGLVAAVGWVSLVGLAIVEQGTGAITRNFSTYVTSNSILIGAEVDKVIVVLMVTAVLTFAVWRARNTLVIAVREAEAAREIGRFLSQGVADAISRADVSIEAGQAVERHAAIIMLDIRGFTRFSQTVPPREIVDLLTGFHARVLPIVHAQGGVVDKFLGDGIMLTFGAVEPMPDASARAITALETIMAEAARWSAEQSALGRTLAVNGAMAAGPVVFAALGSANRLEYTVIGEAVNLAAKLEKHNKAEGTRALCEAGTYAQACAQGFVPIGHIVERQQRAVSGVTAPMDLVELR
jgi:adenylate cyclase